MEKKKELPPEVEGMFEDFLEKPAEPKMLALEDVDGVSGGVPERFVCNGNTFTPDELYNYTRQLNDKMNTNVAIEFLSSMLKDAGYPDVQDAVDAYLVYGKAMWMELARKGM